MAVYDRWHRSHPRKGDQPCEHSRGKTRLYATAEHDKGMRWQVRWRDEAGEQQKLNRPKKGGRQGESDPDIYAEALDAKITTELNTGIYFDPRAGKISLESYAKQWHAGLTVDIVTITNLSSILGKWVYGSSIADQEMATLAKHPSLIQSWIKHMQKHLEPSTIQKIVGWVSTIFEIAVTDKVVARNPVRTKAVTPPKVIPKRVVPWTLEEVEALAEALPARFAVMPEIGVGVAMRQGELFGLAKTDVQLMMHIRRQVRLVKAEDGTYMLVFAPPKGGKERDVPISEHVRARLRAHMKEFPPVKVTLPWIRADSKKLVTAELLFVNDDGTPLNRNTFNRQQWRPARRAAGIADTRENGMHALRHTAASAWLAAGVDINTVAELLGHDDPGFTLRTYIHLMPNAATRGRAAMDLFFRRAGQGEIAGQGALDVPSEGSG